MGDKTPGQVPDRETLIAAAAEIHDGRCGCDRKYRMSCPDMANAILEAAKRLREAAPASAQVPGCEHDWVTVYGPRYHIRSCSLCGELDWADLDQQITRSAAAQERPAPGAAAQALAAVLRDREILVTRVHSAPGESRWLAKPARPDDLAVQLLGAIDIRLTDDPKPSPALAAYAGDNDRLRRRIASLLERFGGLLPAADLAREYRDAQLPLPGRLEDVGGDGAAPRQELALLVAQELAAAYRQGTASFTSAGSGILGYPGEAAAVAAVMAAVEDLVTSGVNAALEVALRLHEGRQREDGAGDVPADEDDAAPGGAGNETEH